MAGVKALVALAFLASTGITLLVLGCALKDFDNNWWPMFVLFFYVLAPIPYLIARRYGEEVETSSTLIEICAFVTTCFVVSAYGLPIVLAHGPLSPHSVIKWRACGFILGGNTVIFATIALFFYTFGREDAFEYSTW